MWQKRPVVWQIVQQSILNYSGSEGARVKASPLFFVFIFGVLNFQRGYKAETRIEPGY